MSTAEFLQQLGRTGLKLWLEGDRLRYSAPQGAFPPEMREQVSARKTEIVRFLRQARTGGATPLAPVPRGGLVPLSFAQRRLWFLDRLEPGNPAYVIFGAFRLRGALDPDRLDGAFRALIRRHEICRTGFQIVDGEPFQQIADAVPFALERADLRALSGPEASAGVQRLTDDIARRPFDLARPPLLRGTLIQRTGDEWFLALAMHHAVSDEWSIGVLLRDLSALYAAASGESLPALPLQYADYALWQRNAAADAQATAHVEDWKRVLRAPLPVLDLPTRGPRPAMQSSAGARLGRRLPRAMLDALTRLAREEGATPFMALLAAFLVVLSRHSGQEDIALGTVIAGRSEPALENLIGCFVNTLVLRNDLSGNPSFRDLLRRVRRVALDAYARSETPFEALVDALAAPRDPSRSPLFQVAFILENVPRGDLELPGIAVEILESEERAAKFELTLVVAERADGPVAMFDYNTDLFGREAIERMLDHLFAAFEAAARAPDQCCGEFSLLGDAERRELAAFELGSPSAVSPGASLHGLFAAQAAKTPSAVALAMGDAELSYRALDERANRLANYLRAKGIRPGDAVGLCLPRSFDMVVAVLAVLKAGGAYVPLDPAYPAARLNLITANAAMRCLLTDADTWRAQTLSQAAGDATVVLLDAAQDAIAAQSAQALPQAGAADAIACIIYTSGSTGTPKGVKLAHSGLCNLALAQIDAFGIHPPCSVLQFASLNFDASASEIFTALLSGATLFLAARERLLTGLGDVLREARIAVVTLPPAVLKLLPHEHLPDLATLVVAGEVCPADLAARWQAGRRFLNAYGPTEASVCATIGEIAPGEAVLPVGRPMAGARVYILDRHLGRVPVGVAGEIHIAGIGVAPGYIGRPDLTAERFIADPFAAGARMYKTGDLARWRPDGQIEYLGRLDHQIKLRGMRVETGEIEAELSRHPAIREALVMARTAPGRDTYLAAYVVPRGEAPAPAGAELKAWLRRTLPAHLIPAVIMPVAAFALGPTGKIDRAALPAPELAAPNRAAPPTAPRDDVELRLLRLWESVLPLRSMGVGDDFFDAGGHSLLVVKLLALIEREFGKALTVAEVIASPTIEALARLLRRQAATRPWSPLVELRASAAGVPLFCVHPLGGNVIGYLPLARHLPAAQAFYALQAPGLEPGTQACARIEDLAALYLQAVREIQPRGPYRLGGHSFGGVVAFEMARQLRRRGAAIDLLVMMDTPAPVEKNRPQAVADDGEWLLRRVRVLEAFYGAGMALSDAAFRALPPDRQSDEFLRYMRRANLLPEEAGADLVGRILAVQRAGHQAAVDYRPDGYDGAIHVLRAGERADRDADASAFADPRLDWGALTAGAVIVEQVSGDHISMLAEPHVQAVAERLRAWIAGRPV